MAAVPKKIVIIGAGNMAWHLAALFGTTGNRIVQVFNHRLSKQAKSLAATSGAALVTQYNRVDPSADVYIICVKDEAIAEVAKKLESLKLKGLVLHTSGSSDMELLKGASKQYGVFYPLQTLSAGDPVYWQDIPVLVEGNTPAAMATVRKLAAPVSGKVIVCDSAERLKWHLSAVLACNFSNALYTLTSDYMKQVLPNRSFSLLLPLIRQTVTKLDHMSPREAQTGPARRGDKKTIRKHLALLEKDPLAKAIYTLMTKAIAQQQG